MVMRGYGIRMVVELIQPIAIREGDAVCNPRGGPNVVGAGLVATILQ